MKRKPRLGEIVFWPNHATFGVVIGPEFWAKEASENLESVKRAVSKGGITLLLLGSLMALKFPFGPELDPEPRVKHSNLYFMANPADLISIGSPEELIKVCRCAICFAGPRDGEYLQSVRDEARALLKRKGCIPELAEFFAKAIPKK